MTAVNTTPVRTLPYTSLALLQALDVFTTWWILHQWEIRAEANPIAYWVFNTLGLNLGVLLLTLIKFGCVYGLYRKQSGVRLVTAIYSLVIFNNLLFLVLWFVS